MSRSKCFQTAYKSIDIGGLDIFYREAGPMGAPVIVMLHGFPTSSHMFRNLIPSLADEFRVVAPDYPGFGSSSIRATASKFFVIQDIVSGSPITPV